MGDDHRLALFRSKVTIRKKALSVIKRYGLKNRKKTTTNWNNIKKEATNLLVEKLNFLSLLDGVSTTYWRAFHFTNSFFESSPTRSPEKELEIRGPWKRGLKKWPYFNVGFQLACTRLSVSANKRKMRASSHSKRAKNSRRKKGRACKHTSIHPLPSLQHSRF